GPTGPYHRRGTPLTDPHLAHGRTVALGHRRTRRRHDRTPGHDQCRGTGAGRARTPGDGCLHRLRPCCRTTAHPTSTRRLPPGSGHPHRLRVGPARLRGGAHRPGPGPTATGQPAPGRGRDAAFVRLRRRLPPGRASGQHRTGTGRPFLGRPQPGRLLSWLRRGGRHRPGQTPDRATGLRVRQGRLRSSLRSTQQASLVARAPGIHRHGHRTTFRGSSLDNTVHHKYYGAVLTPSRSTQRSSPEKTTTTRRTTKKTSTHSGSTTTRRVGGPDPELITAIDRVVDGWHHDPHSVLGVHPEGRGTVVRALRPGAREVHAVFADGSRVPLTHLHRGVFTGKVTKKALGTPVDYRIATRYEEGADEHVIADPYHFAPSLGDLDLYLIGEGRHEELWHALGSHTMCEETRIGEVPGTRFTVWAPDARGIRLIGDFNHWNGVGHPMRSLGSSGVWELFMPDLGPGDLYKFQVLGADGQWRDKADPMARATQLPPATASVITESHHEWGDQEWMAERKGVEPHRAPMSVYEVHLGSWRPGLSYTELARELVEYVTEMGFTHVEFLPVAGHPFDGSWGYQVTSYYAVTPRFGSPDEFRHLVDCLHRAGIGVFLDWVPAHFPRDAWALAQFDGTALYEHPDPRRGEHPDWGTLI